MYTKLEQIMWLLSLLYEMSDDDWDHVTLCMGCVLGVWTDTVHPYITGLRSGHRLLTSKKQVLHILRRIRHKCILLTSAVVYKLVWWWHIVTHYKWWGLMTVYYLMCPRLALSSAGDLNCSSRVPVTRPRPIMRLPRSDQINQQSIQTQNIKGGL